MSKPVNLNRFRKTRARTAHKARADQNAAKFGRSKAQKNLEQARQEKAAHDLTAHRIEE